jgi:hypothetical protein
MLTEIHVSVSYLLPPSSHYIIRQGLVSYNFSHSVKDIADSQDHRATDILTV